MLASRHLLMLRQANFVGLSSCKDYLQTVEQGDHMETTCVCRTADTFRGAEGASVMDQGLRVLTMRGTPERLLVNLWRLLAWSKLHNIKTHQQSSATLTASNVPARGISLKTLLLLHCCCSCF